MLKAIKLLKEGEKAACGTFERLGNEVLNTLCRTNPFRISGNKPDLIARLIAAGVQEQKSDDKQIDENVCDVLIRGIVCPHPKATPSITTPQSYSPHHKAAQHNHLIVQTN